MPDSDLLGAFEVHSPEGIGKALAEGTSPVALIKGRKPVDHLIEAYLRSSRFADCLRVMLNAGAVIDDPLLEAVLLDDASRLRRLVTEVPQRLHQKVDLPRLRSHPAEVSQPFTSALSSTPWNAPMS